MDPARTSSSATFTDGLGDRHHTSGPAAEPLEVFTLRKELTTAPAFEFALRERVSRLAGFSHECYGPVRGVSRLGTDASSLALVSDRVAGDRLSNILAVADRELLPLEIGAALALIQQLVDAVAALHETISDVCHGAIAPERIVITPDGRLVLVEHVLGAALGSLQYSRDRYWKELRVALPPTAGAPHFDRRADVTQVGAVALALITGRPLADNHYPDRVSEIVSRVGAVSASGGLEPLPDAFRGWLSRALQLDARQSFGSAIDAREELQRVLSDTGYAAAPAKLHVFLAQCRPLAATPSAPVAAAPVAFPSASRIPAPVAPKRPASSPSNSFAPPARRSVEPSSIHRRAVPVQRVAATTIPSPRRRRTVAAALFVTIASMATLTAGTYLTSIEAPPGGVGRLMVNSNPPGAVVNVDGRARGTTPTALPLLPGEHRLEVISASGRRSEPVYVLANESIVRTFDLTGASDANDEAAIPAVGSAGLEAAPANNEPEVAPAVADTASVASVETAPHAVPSTGWISVSAPVELRVSLNRKLLGTTRTSRIVAPVGRHQVEIISEPLGYKLTRPITVSAGRVSTIPVDWPTGSLSVNALPWAEVWVDGERIGETPIGNLALPIGTHEVVFRHPELGEKRQRVTVKASEPARISMDLRQK
jgi:serine/threonine protein kinase